MLPDAGRRTSHYRMQSPESIKLHINASALLQCPATAVAPHQTMACAVCCVRCPRFNIASRTGAWGLHASSPPRVTPAAQDNRLEPLAAAAASPHCKASMCVGLAVRTRLAPGKQLPYRHLRICLLSSVGLPRCAVVA